MKNRISALALFCFMASCAYAASTQLNINAAVSTSCAFTGTNGGVMAVLPSQPNLMSTQASGGAPATANISFTGTPTLTISEITGFDSVPSGFSPTLTFTNTASSNLLGALTFSNGSATGNYTSGSSDTISVNLGVQSNAAFVTGNYISSTTLTCQ